jgi:hypothetical protein
MKINFIKASLGLFRKINSVFTGLAAVYLLDAIYVWPSTSQNSKGIYMIIFLKF